VASCYSSELGVESGGVPTADAVVESPIALATVEVP
jgi:hypothetical protein